MYPFFRELVCGLMAPHIRSSEGVDRPKFCRASRGDGLGLPLLVNSLGGKFPRVDNPAE